MPKSCVGHILDCLNRDDLVELCRKKDFKVSGKKSVLHRRLTSSFKGEPYKVLISLNVTQLRQICQRSTFEENDIEYSLNDQGTKAQIINRIIEYCNEYLGSNSLNEMPRYESENTSINSLEFIRVIGEGAFGEAHLCEDTFLKKKIIVKKLHDADNDDVEKILREARILAKVDKNPNIVTIHRIEVSPPAIYMEYCDCGNLWDKIVNEEIPFRDNKAIRRLIKDLSNALTAIHGENMVHRDLGPHNIFLENDGSAKVGDFGISYAPEDVLTSLYKSTGNYYHHPIFHAPEYDDYWDIEPSYDMYTLGQVIASCWEGITRKPIDRSTMPKKNSGIDELIWTIAWLLLSDDPDRRPSAEEVLEIIS